MISLVISFILIKQIFLDINNEIITIKSFEKNNISLNSKTPFKIYQYIYSIDHNYFDKDLDNYINYIIFNFEKGKNSKTMIFSYLSESDIIYQYNHFYGFESSCYLSEKRVCSFHDSNFNSIFCYFQ